MLTMWHPYDDWGFGNLRRTLSTMEALRREMGSLLGEAPRWYGGDADTRGGLPASTFKDTGDNLVLKAEVPGLSEQDIEVTVTGDTVTVRGERKADTPEGYAVYRQERGAFKFAQSYVLPTKVDADKAQATVKNGVLELVLPKAAEAQPKRISVKSN